MQIVLDTSALLAVLFDEPERPSLITATRGAVLVAPGVLPWEVGNALVAAIRRRRLTASEASAAWASFESVPLRLLDVHIPDAVTLASESGLYAYDAYFLALARSRGLPLLTLDRRLAEAAARIHVRLVALP